MKLNIYLFTLQLLILSLLLTTPSFGQGGCWLSGWCPINPNQATQFVPVTELTPGSYLIDIGSAGYGSTVPTTWKTYGPYTLSGGYKYSAVVGSGASLIFGQAPYMLQPFGTRYGAMVYGKNTAWGGEWYALRFRPTGGGGYPAPNYYGSDYYGPDYYGPNYYGPDYFGPDYYWSWEFGPGPEYGPGEGDFIGPPAPGDGDFMGPPEPGDGGAPEPGTMKSDIRLKTNITPIGIGLQEILRLNPVTFNWKKDSNSPLHYGLVAQEVEKVIPDAVTRSDVVTNDTPDGTLNIKYEELIPILVKSIQELNAKVKSLENESAGA